MFSESVIKENEAMVERWRKKCSELYGEREFKGQTYSRIELKPVYTPADIEGLDYKDIPLPGEYPFTRGHSPIQYQVKPWMMRIGYGYGSGQDTRERREFLASIGYSQEVGKDRPAPFILFPDIVGIRGYDPDEPAARGKVGRDGMTVSTVTELDEVFRNVPLDEVQTQFIAQSSSLAYNSMYIALAKRHGIPESKLRMKGSSNLYHSWWYDVASFPPQNALKLIVEQIKYFTKFMPLVQSHSICGYNAAETGATAAQEIAFMLAHTITVTEECIKVGLEPDDFIPRWYNHDHLTCDVFETIAKFRAKRRMWAKIFKERFGCKKPESLGLYFVPTTGGSVQTAQEPLNNIIRITIMALAAVLAGADGLWTQSYDEGLRIPSQEAVRIAIRTQQIIYDETNIPYVVDPMGGSYYVEWLTNRIEEDACKLLQEIDNLGGYMKCWESGWLRREIEISANERQRRIDSGEEVRIGQNKYRLPPEQQPKIQLHKVDPKVEEEAIARIRKFRAERDNEKTGAALAKMRIAAQKLVDDWPGSCGCLMPTIIDAFEADATLGEVQQVLREVYGFGYTY